MPRSLHLLCAFFLCVLHLSALAHAQSAVPPAARSGAPEATFTFDFPASQPQHYSIRVSADGPAHYQSTGRISADSDDTDSFDFEFPLSAETRSRIFALAAKAGYFQKDLDTHRKGLAFTGTKTLTYKDAHRAGESTYIYSSNIAVQELTSLFQNLSATLEFGHRLDYAHRYQKLALDQELKRMQETSDLIEVTAIQPILERIIADQSVVNVARARAQRLLAVPGGR